MMYSGLVPTFAALVISSLVILISDVFPRATHRIFFQFLCFGASLGVCVYTLASSQTTSLSGFLRSFHALPAEMRFYLSMAVIAAVYFGAGMFAASPAAAEFVQQRASVVTHQVNPESPFSTPASCDNDIGFEVPSKVPEDDRALFDMVLDK